MVPLEVLICDYSLLCCKGYLDYYTALENVERATRLAKRHWGAAEGRMHQLVTSWPSTLWPILWELVQTSDFWHCWGHCRSSACRLQEASECLLHCVSELVHDHMVVRFSSDGSTAMMADDWRWWWWSARRWHVSICVCWCCVCACMRVWRGSNTVWSCSHCVSKNKWIQIKKESSLMVLSLKS